MDREQAKEIVKSELEGYLRNKGINTRKPFRCLNPAHNDRTASMSIDRSSKSGIHCKCFGCNAYYDTFDLIGLDYGLTDEKEIFDKAYEIFNLQVDTQDNIHNSNYTTKDTQSYIHNSNYIKNNDNIIDEPLKVISLDLQQPIEEAHKALLSNEKALTYIKGRGLSDSIIEEYKIGYSEKGHNDILKSYEEFKSKSAKSPLYKYIFPFKDINNSMSYFLSEIIDRTKVDDFNKKYKKINKGDSDLAAPIFNERYLQAAEEAPEVIFICEGIYDALSVEEVGGKAISFTGTAHRRFLQLCKKYKPNTRFVIALDNDAAGQKATDAITVGLDLLKIPYIIDTAANSKDFNDELRENRAAFSKHIESAISEATRAEREQQEIRRKDYMNNSTANYLQAFIDNIEKSKHTRYYSTGFQSIDELLDGGLYSGLYCIGAISSLGKTTFCLHVLDNIAAAGKDVLIISLEMSRQELMAKSISRHTLIEDLKQHNSTSHAKTTRGITTGSRYANYSEKDREIIEAGITAYSKYADHIYIYEGVGDIGVKEVREIVKEHIELTGNRPVVLIDYLQILAPYNEKATDKQNTDKAVLELKRISRDYSIPVIGISSFNRDNYNSPVNMASFKESGAVEYSSDVLLALQYEGMDWIENETEKERNKRIRQLMKDVIAAAKEGKPQSIQVKVLKNRNGSKGDTCIDFYPAFNCFVEKEDPMFFQPEEYNEGWEVLSSSDPKFEGN